MSEPRFIGADGTEVTGDLAKVMRHIISKHKDEIRVAVRRRMREWIRGG